MSFVKFSELMPFIFRSPASNIGKIIEISASFNDLIKLYNFHLILNIYEVG